MNSSAWVRVTPSRGMELTALDRLPGALRVSGPKADFILTGFGKIALSGVGIHVGGAFSGVTDLPGGGKIRAKGYVEITSVRGDDRALTIGGAASGSNAMYGIRTPRPSSPG